MNLIKAALCFRPELCDQGSRCDASQSVDSASQDEV
jgi:hypothetical protein